MQRDVGVVCACSPECQEPVAVDVFPERDQVSIEVDNIEIVVSLSALRRALDEGTMTSTGRVVIDGQ